MRQGADQDALRAPSGAGFGRSGQLTRSPEGIRPRPGAVWVAAVEGGRGRTDDRLDVALTAGAPSWRHCSGGAAPSSPPTNTAYRWAASCPGPTARTELPRDRTARPGVGLATAGPGQGLHRGVGKARERVFDVVCSDGLTPDTDTHRCVRLTDITRVGVPGWQAPTWHDVPVGRHVQGCLTEEGVFAVYDTAVALVGARGEG